MAKRVRAQSSRTATPPPRLDGQAVNALERSAAVVSWPAVPLAAPASPSPDAVELFQDAMAALQRKQYRDAARRFQAVLQQHSNERALADRARVYLDLCERELEKRPANPQTVEERLTAATAALNNGEDDEAERLAEGVLTKQPDQDLALYLLAAIHARRNAVPAALELLGRAIALSPEAGQQARFDPDFDALHDAEEFWRMTDKRVASENGGKRLRNRRER